MKNPHRCLGRNLITFLLFCSSGAYAPLAGDPQRDIAVTFSSRHEGDDPGILFGTARNNSRDAYPCVRIEFDLYTRFDLRQPGEDGLHLGVLPLELRNLQPREARGYQQRLPQPAGVALRSVSECAERPVTELPDAPRTPPTGTCSITGRISGKLHWDTTDDRGQPVSYTLEHMYMRTPGVDQPEQAKVRGREYIFENVTAGRTYTIFPGGFRSTPRQRVVPCRANTINRQVDFEITGAPPSG